MKRGFTLLEVLIALACLAVIYASVSGIITTSGYLMYKAPRFSQAALMLRGVILDLEEHYNLEGFPSNDVSRKRCELPDHAGDGWECRYDLEQMDIENNDLSQMAAELMESLYGQVGDQGNILQLFPVLAFLFATPELIISPLTCPVQNQQVLKLCAVDLGKLAQNIGGTIMMFPMFIAEAAKQTRKLRVTITHKSESEPIVVVETFIISVPEETKALQEEGAIGDPEDNTPYVPPTGGGNKKTGGGGGGGGR